MVITEEEDLWVMSVVSAIDLYTSGQIRSVVNVTPLLGLSSFWFKQEIFGSWNSLLVRAPDS